EVVKERYGKAALRVVEGGAASCCGSKPTPLGAVDPITANLYSDAQTAGLPEEALIASLGCGN
ncbi:MAG TPA: arsenite S-adenosylmethyltransferase, partial [Solibacterales bacterium]|nr:arsenite S-adenosylmethyltransferase [Bryobacterales bacterium]